MPDSTLAGIIQASAGVFTALAVLVTAITGFIVARRNYRKLNAKVDGVQIEVSDVHTIVNQRQSDHETIIRNQQDFIRALKRALKTANIEIPVDQSLPEDTITK